MRDAVLQTNPALAAVRELLLACALPVSDLHEQDMARFTGFKKSGTLVAVIGYEQYADHALLRSLAVASDHRGCGLARALVETLEARLQQLGVRQVWLLTETAAEFFAGCGYAQVDRALAPADLQACAEFTSLCPASAALMCRSIGTGQM